MSIDKKHFVSIMNNASKRQKLVLCFEPPKKAYM